MDAADLLSNQDRFTPDWEALLELETGERFSYAALGGRPGHIWGHTLSMKMGAYSGYHFRD